MARNSSAPTAPRSSLREAQKELTRQRLYETGIQAFIENSYTRTTIDDIATAAGATRATFYLHYTAKSELVRELIVSWRGDTKRIYTELGEIVVDGAYGDIRAWLDRLLRKWPAMRGYAAVLEDAVATEPDIRAEHETTFEFGVERIAAGMIRAGRFAPSSRAPRARLALLQLDPVFMRWRRVGWRGDRGATLDGLAEMWTIGLGDRTTIPPSPGSAPGPARNDATR
jgi:AcrR family transcriptional regulator